MVVNPPREQRGPLGKINGFQLLKFLGKGTFGAVYQARREADGKIYAIKKVDTRRMTSKERAEAVNEIRVLASVAGEHVITFYEAFVEQDVLYIVTEYAGNGDLLAYLKNKRRAGHLPEATVWSFFIQMLLGTKTMHENNILHRDLKAANVFLSSGSYLKLGDLGVAKVLKHDQALASTQVGTPYYVAPEVWRNKPYNSKCDVWSLGCLLYELCTFKPPFEAESMEGLARKVMKGKYEQIPSFYSQALRTTLAKLLVVEPKQRASVEEILACEEVRSRLGSITDAISAQNDHHTAEPVDIVKTIAVPRRFNDLTKNLPPSRYEAKEASPQGLGHSEAAAMAPHVAHQGKAPPGIDPSTRNAAESRSPSEAGYPPKQYGQQQQPPTPQQQQYRRQLPPGVPGKPPPPGAMEAHQQHKLQHAQQQQQHQQHQHQHAGFNQQQQAAAAAAAAVMAGRKPQLVGHHRRDDGSSVGGGSVLSQQHGAGPHPLHYGQPLQQPSMRPGLKLPHVPGAQPPPTPSSYSQGHRARYAPLTPQQQPGAYGAGGVQPSREIRMVYHAPNGDSRVSIFARGGYNPITHTQMHTGGSRAYQHSRHSQQPEYSAQRRRVTPSHWY